MREEKEANLMEIYGLKELPKRECLLTYGIVVRASEPYWNEQKKEFVSQMEIIDDSFSVKQLKDQKTIHL